ncbi:uncharacterized protein METZ01_LOCUS277559, partial [marine metagenome]
MKIAVLGAAGWVGRAILKSLEGRHQIRAFDLGPKSWEADGPWDGGKVIHGQISDYETVDRVIEGVDAVIHVAVYFGPYEKNDDLPFLVNLKGLWNTLESARQRGVRRIVHIGSCQVEHPDSTFFTADVRRPDGTLYAVSKRLQEEMCRQFHDAYGTSLVVLRPCSIVDSRLDLGKGGAKLGPGSWSVSMVCRHDLAEA